MLTLVFLPAIQQWELMGWDEMAYEPVARTRIWVIEGKFQWHFDQGNVNLLRGSREFELSEFELTKLKITEKWGEIQTKLIGLSSS